MLTRRNLLRGLLAAPAVAVLPTPDFVEPPSVGVHLYAGGTLWVDPGHDESVGKVYIALLTRGGAPC